MPTIEEIVNIVNKEVKEIYYELDALDELIFTKTITAIKQETWSTAQTGDNPKVTHHEYVGLFFKMTDCYNRTISFEVLYQDLANRENPAQAVRDVLFSMYNQLNLRPKIIE